MAANDDKEGTDEGQENAPEDGVLLSKIPGVASSDAELKQSVTSSEPNYAKRAFVLGATNLALTSLALLNSYRVLLNSEHMLRNSDSMVRNSDRIIRKNEEDEERRRNAHQD